MADDDVDMVCWEWLCHLNKSISTTSNEINPEMHRCACGNSWYLSKWDYVRLVLFGRLVKTCPQCRRKHEYKLIKHVIEEHDNTRVPNTELMERKSRLWRNP